MFVRIQKKVCYGAVLILLAGCGGSKIPEAPVIDTFPFVQCSIQMEGKPVERAIVAFRAADGKSSEIVSSYDSDDSCYRFITVEAGVKKAGVPEGKYTVSVKPGRGDKTKIPAKYADPAKSGLVAEVKPGENFLPTFEMTP